MIYREKTQGGVARRSQCSRAMESARSDARCGASARRLRHIFRPHIRVPALRFGGVAIDRTGTPLPADTLAGCRSADTILLGAISGPQWDAFPLESVRKAACSVCARRSASINFRRGSSASRVCGACRRCAGTSRRLRFRNRARAGGRRSSGGTSSRARAATRARAMSPSTPPRKWNASLATPSSAPPPQPSRHERG